MTSLLARVRTGLGLFTGVIVIVAMVTATTPAAAKADQIDGTVLAQLGDPAALDDLLADYDLRVVDALVPSRGLYVLAPSRPAEKSDVVKKLAKELDKDPAVLWAEVESADDEPGDDRFHAWPEGQPSRADLDVDTWLTQDGLEYLQLAAVHRRATGAGVTVAILDTGVDVDHPQLMDKLADNRHFDYIDDDADPSEEADGVDDDGDGVADEAFGHGTHAAGLVALVAPDADIVSFRVLDADGNGNPYVVGLAVHDAIDAGADVINVSFGMDHKPKSKFLREAFKRAKKENVVVVAAAGNNGDDEKRYPAHEKDVIGVAAAGRGGVVTGFSNYGKTALVAAPGQDVVSTLPGGGFGAWSGTSMAAPIVAGQAALVQEANPGMNSKKVIEIVGRSSTKILGGHKIDKGLIDILRSLEN